MGGYSVYSLYVYFKFHTFDGSRIVIGGVPWFLVVLILCATSGAMKKCVKAFKAVAFIALVIFVVQTFIVPGGEVLWRFGILRICEKGLRTAISLSFMVMDIAGIFVWYFQTTSNKEIARALEESGMNYKRYMCLHRPYR